MSEQKQAEPEPNHIQVLKELTLRDVQSKLQGMSEPKEIIQKLQEMLQYILQVKDMIFAERYRFLSWGRIMTTIRNMTNLETALEMTYDVINQKHIFNRPSQRLLDALKEVNTELYDQDIKDIDKIEDYHEKGSHKYKEKEQKLLTLKHRILNILDEAYIVSLSVETQRFNRLEEQNKLVDTLMFCKKSAQEGKLGVATAGPFENSVNQQYSRVFGAPKQTNERKPKAEERRIYREEGQINAKRLNEQLADKLEQVSNKKKKENLPSKQID